MAKPSRLFKISFLNQARVYELYARRVSTSEVLGFTEIAELVFETTGIVVDPIEERLREEFRDTLVLHLPMHAVLRIEEVARRGPLAIRDAETGEKIMPFPMSNPRVT